MVAICAHFDVHRKSTFPTSPALPGKRHDDDHRGADEDFVDPRLIFGPDLQPFGQEAANTLSALVPAVGPSRKCAMSQAMSRLQKSRKEAVHVAASCQAAQRLTHDLHVLLRHRPRSISRTGWGRKPTGGSPGRQPRRGREFTARKLGHVYCSDTRRQRDPSLRDRDLRSGAKHSAWSSAQPASSGPRPRRATRLRATRLRRVGSATRRCPQVAGSRRRLSPEFLRRLRSPSHRPERLEVVDDVVDPQTVDGTGEGEVPALADSGRENLGPGQGRQERLDIGERAAGSSSGRSSPPSGAS